MLGFFLVLFAGGAIVWGLCRALAERFGDPADLAAYERGFSPKTRPAWRLRKRRPRWRR